MTRKRFKKLVRAHATRFAPPEKRNRLYQLARDTKLMGGSYLELWDAIMFICDGDNRGVGVKQK